MTNTRLYEVIEALHEELDCDAEEATPLMVGAVVRAAAEYVVNEREALIDDLERSLAPSDELTAFVQRYRQR